MIPFLKLSPPSNNGSEGTKEVANVFQANNLCPNFFEKHDEFVVVIRHRLGNFTLMLFFGLHLRPIAFTC